MKHFEEDKIYLISNYAVARNPIFINKDIQIRFKNKMEIYLSPIANIMSYNLRDHEFQILLKLKSREEFESFYDLKKNQPIGLGIPESSYIFSQQMSNLQVSLVKNFNHKFKRSGSLMAGRFQRRAIHNPEEVVRLVEGMNNGKEMHSYYGQWIYDLNRSVGAMTSKDLFTSNNINQEGEFEGFIDYKKINLAGQLLNQEIPFIIPSVFYYQRQLFKAFCKFHE